MVANGESYATIASTLGLMTTASFARYRRCFPEFDDQFNDSILANCLHLEQELLEIPHKYDKDTAKLLSDNIRWLLSVRNFKRYAPRQQHEVNVSVDLSGAIAQANQRVVEIEASNVYQLPAKKEER